MISRSLRSTLLFTLVTLGSALGVGCAAPAAEDTSEGALAAHKADAATPEVRVLTKQNQQCALDAAYIAVAPLTPKKASDAINATLLAAATDALAFPMPGAAFDCSKSKLVVQNTMSAPVDEGGLFVVHSVTTADDYRPLKTTKMISQLLTFRRYLFDLHDGKHLALTDVLDAAGLALVRAQCEGEIKMPHPATVCADMLAPPAGSAASFGIEPGGLRVNPTTASGIDSSVYANWLTSEGVLVPWTTLKGHILHPAVIVYAGKPQA
jgi:hypothetical protein